MALKVTLIRMILLNTAVLPTLTVRARLGLTQAMAATTDAIVALQSHGTEGAPTLSDS